MTAPLRNPGWRWIRGPFRCWSNDPRKGDRLRERISLQGNPMMKDDWFTNPKTGEPVDFIAFARTEGRFGISPAGNPTIL